MSKELGFIGVGNMGLPMARRLVEAGFQLTIFDVRREPVQRLVQLGAKAASSPKEVADLCETVFLSLPTPSILKTVTFGADGAAHGSRMKRYVDLSTTGPTASIAIGKELAEKKIVHMDSPVSGGVGGAEKGTLAVMVSGPKKDFDEIVDLSVELGILPRRIEFAEYVDNSFAPDLETVDLPFDRLPDVDKVASQP